MRDQRGVKLFSITCTQQAARGHAWPRRRRVLGCCSGRFMTVVAQLSGGNAQRAFWGESAMQPRCLSGCALQNSRFGFSRGILIILDNEQQRQRQRSSVPSSRSRGVRCVRSQKPFLPALLLLVPARRPAAPLLLPAAAVAITTTPFFFFLRQQQQRFQPSPRRLRQP